MEQPPFGTAQPLAEYLVRQLTELWSTVSQNVTIMESIMLTGYSNITGKAQIYLSGKLGNRIDMGFAGEGLPAFTTRSDGTKIVLSPTLSSTELDSAIGRAPGVMWFTTRNNSGVFNFYNGSLTPSTIISADGTIRPAVGVMFSTPATSSTNTRVLDDYVEAPWAPTVTGITYTGTNTSVFTFTKIGRLVMVNVVISASTSVAIAAGATITLPYPTITLGGSGVFVNPSNTTAFPAGLYNNAIRVPGVIPTTANWFLSACYMTNT